MKLSKIAKLVKRYGVLDVYRVNKVDVWLGVGSAIYKCSGLPLIYGERNARAVLGLSKEEFAKINFHEKDIDMQKDDGCSFHDQDGTETGTNELEMCAAVGGTAFSILECPDGELIFTTTIYFCRLAPNSSSLHSCAPAKIKRKTDILP